MSWHEKKGNFLPAKDLVQFDESKIKILKSIDWYDGPLTGFIEYEGTVYWFDFAGDCPHCNEIGCDHEGGGRHYFYRVFPLTEEQLAEREANNEEYLGPDMTGIDSIAWFTDGCNQNFYAINVCFNKAHTTETCDCDIIKVKK